MNDNKDYSVESILLRTRAMNHALENFVRVLESMDCGDEIPRSMVSLDKNVVEDIKDLLKFLAFSSVTFSSTRIEQIDRLREALTNV